MIHGLFLLGLVLITFKILGIAKISWFLACLPFIILSAFFCMVAIFSIIILFSTGAWIASF